MAVLVDVNSRRMTPGNYTSPAAALPLGARNVTIEVDRLDAKSLSGLLALATIEVSVDGGAFAPVLVMGMDGGIDIDEATGEEQTTTTSQMSLSGDLDRPRQIRAVVQVFQTFRAGFRVYAD